MAGPFMQVFFYMYKYIYFWNNKGLKWMILKERKNLVLKEKYFEKCHKFFISFYSQNKTVHFSAAPPP